MEESEDLESAQRLRVELKSWEKAFALANDGRKAARDDIKKDPVVAQRYKEYNKLTGRASARDVARVVTSTPSQSRKRYRDAIDDESSIAEATKRSRQLHPADLDPYDAPLHTTPSAVRTSIGPTPQKNGQILGIFDLLSPLKAGKDTPSRKARTSMDPLNSTLTPSRQRFADLPGQTPSRSAGTPHRVRLQHQAHEFITPSAPRFTSKPVSGSGKSKHDDTPAFLRRHSSKLGPAPDENSEMHESMSFSPVVVRLPPRAVGKGLSALVQGLRDMEDERLDDDLDMLREMEAEESGGVAMPAKPKVLVEDSQIPVDTIELPLGADGEGPASDEDELAQGDGSQPTRKWKKRGQKRTTRKVNIVPSTVKWKPEPEWKVGKENDETHDNDSEKRPTEATNAKGKEKVGFRKKISATAHANFRALKIRSKNSKGKGGRFGGRRR